MDNKIKQFNNHTVKTVRNEIDAALKEVGNRLGVKISGLGNLSYNGTTVFTQKLTIALESSQMEASSNLQDYVGERFKSGGRTFTIISTENGKLLGRTNRGARYLLTIPQVLAMIKL